MKRGKFIAIEGVDNAGKTTQASLLQQYFSKREKELYISHEHGGTIEGEKIRKILLERNTMLDPITQTLLFYSSRREFILRIVKPKLDQGIHVITDRFEASTFVYQGYVQDVPIELISSLHTHVFTKSDCIPDTYIILDIPVEEIIRRTHNKDREHQLEVYEKQDKMFLTKLREGYLYYAQKNHITVIDGTKTKQEVYRQIIKLIAPILTNWRS